MFRPDTTYPMRNKQTPLISNAVLIAAFAATAICLLFYLRALACGFVNFDDPAYVLENTAIRQLDSAFFLSAFSRAYEGFWMPLTWISLAVDYHFWGLNPFGYHLTNILLHAANTGLVVLIADRLLRRGPDPKSGPEGSGDQQGYSRTYAAMLLLAGLLWGIHPLRVESVTWVTERKDVLNGLFSLGSIFCYLRYVHLKGVQGKERNAACSYVLSLILLLLSLMAKSVSVVIPVMLLVVDWYPLGRLRKGSFLPVLREKVPFLVLSAVMTVATIYFASASSILVPADQLSVVDRFVLAGYAVFEYCRYMLWPVGVIHLYLLPYPPSASVIAKATMALLFTCFCLLAGRRKAWIPATWICFLIPLFPTLPFLQNGVQSFAARFTYLPSVAISIASASVIGIACQKALDANKRSLRNLVVLLVAALLVFYGAMTERLIASWNNSETLWTRLIEIRPIGRAYYFRADYYLETGRYGAAAADLLVSIRIAERAGNPEVFNLYVLRGSALFKAGRHEEAVRDFSTAIEMNPQPNYFYHRGLALKAQGKANEAEEDFMRAGPATGPIEWQYLW